MSMKIIVLVIFENKLFYWIEQGVIALKIQIYSKKPLTQALNDGIEMKKISKYIINFEIEVSSPRY